MRTPTKRQVLFERGCFVKNFDERDVDVNTLDQHPAKHASQYIVQGHCNSGAKNLQEQILY